jgi:hypothetical protein
MNLSQPAGKLWVSVPGELAAAVRKRVGSRGVRYDSAINHLLNNSGVQVSELTRAVAQRVAHLLARSKLSSTYAVDAFVVATAAQFDTALIVNDAPDDMIRLAASFRGSVSSRSEQL